MYAIPHRTAPTRTKPNTPMPTSQNIVLTALSAATKKYCAITKPIPFLLRKTTLENQLFL